MTKRPSLAELSLWLHVLAICCSCCVHAASTGVPATPRNRGGAGGGTAAVDGHVEDPHVFVEYVALEDEAADATEAAPQDDTFPGDGSVMDVAPGPKETAAPGDVDTLGAEGHQEEMLGEMDPFAEVLEELQTAPPKTTEELIAEELKNREDELKRRTEEQVKRDEELERRAEEEVRRKEELERRNVEELLREEELKRRREEEERRAQADRLVQEELERRKAAAEIASAASVSSAALTADETFPEDARNKRHEDVQISTLEDQAAMKLEEERKLAENLSRKEEIEIKHFEDGIAHQAAGVEQHQHDAHEHAEIARQREELIEKLEMERRQQEEDVRRLEETRQREEMERLQREQEYIIQQENKKREMEEEPHQHLRVGAGASDALGPASASVTVVLASLLWSLAPLRV